MEENKNKEGISVKELESFVKKHRLKAFLVSLFILASIFGMGLIWSPFWSLLFAGVGGICGALLPERASKISEGTLNFVFKQDSSTQLIFASIWLVLAILVSPFIFLTIGMQAGVDLYTRLSQRARRE